MGEVKPILESACLPLNLLAQTLFRAFFNCGIQDHRIRDTVLGLSLKQFHLHKTPCGRNELGMKFPNRKPWIVTWVALVVAIVIPSSFVGAAEPHGFKVSDTEFEAPSSWKKIKPSSSMRKAQFAVSRDGISDKGEIVFYYFGPGGAGGTKANVTRWYRQFKESENQLGASSEEISVGDISATIVKASGTYLSGSPLGPKTAKPGYALLGAILEAPKGHIFIKFTGPRDLVVDAEKEFKEMVKKAKISR